jgi:hypothetical protein
VAYRQLCAVTFAVLGLVAMGCGGGTSGGTSGNTNGATQAPNNATDQAPNGSGDQPPSTSGDQAPSTSTDTPPASSQDPAGTGDSLSALCRRFCDELVSAAQRCSDEVEVTNCGGPDSCKVPPGVLPCAQQIGDYVDCAIDNLQLVCGGSSGPGQGTGGTNGNAPLPPQQVNPCLDQLKRYTSCAEAHGIGDDDNMNGNMPSGCYQGGGCKMCADDCAKCRCDAGSDVDKLTACVERCPATP